jgi:lysophospholipase L1-like esterase
MAGRWLPVVLVLAAVLAAGCEPRAGARPPGPAPSNLPSSMAALGDSITAGFGACLTLSSCQRSSWATGYSLRVDSHYRRIESGNPAIRGHATNLAVPRARAADLTSQAEAAVRQKVAYVTVLIGGNDACRGGVSDMTSANDFRTQVDRALGALKRGLPSARVLVVSVPNLYRLWEIGHTNPRVVHLWSVGVCPSLLANPTSTAEADVRRRAAVRDRVDAYNRALAAACRAYGSRCRYDGGAAHRIRFTLDMLNAFDYFHPDADGQNALADATYPRSFTW